jgi:hypothetical protein
MRQLKLSLQLFPLNRFALEGALHQPAWFDMANIVRPAVKFVLYSERLQSYITSS